MTLWYCDSHCIVSKDGAGPWDDDTDFFSRIKLAHSECSGFQTGQRNLKGAMNWGYTEIEKEATTVFNDIINSLFHELILSLKSSSKLCLINNKRWN